MNVQRLQLMVTMLREVVAGTWHPTVMPPEDAEYGDYGQEPESISEVFTHWDLRSWLSTDGSPKECGFTACAVGHACLDRRFVDQGLKFDEFSTPVIQVQVRGAWSTWLEDFDAAAYFFDISVEEATRLFSIERGIYETPEHVITRIEDLIAVGLWEQTK